MLRSREWFERDDVYGFTGMRSSSLWMSSFAVLILISGVAPGGAVSWEY